MLVYMRLAFAYTMLLLIGIVRMLLLVYYCNL